MYGDSNIQSEKDTVSDAYDNLFGGDAENNRDAENNEDAEDVGKGSLDASDSSDSDNKEEDIEIGDEAEHEHEWIFAGGQEASYDNYGYNIYFCNICHEIEYMDWENKLVDTSYFAPNVVSSVAIIGRNNWLFLFGYGNIEYYWATNILSEDEMAEYAQKIEELNNICQERGIELGIILAPNKDQVYSEFMPTYTVEDEYKRTERLVDYIKENTEVAITYPKAELEYSDRFWRTYFRYDSHWNHLGAYVGIMALYNEMGYDVISPLELTVNEWDIGQSGDLIILAGLDSSNYPSDVDYNVYYKPEVNITYRSDAVLELSPIYKTESDCGNELKLTLLGDSYRTSMIEYLAKDFSKCSFYHRDYIETAKSDLLESDVLILEAVERSDKALLNQLDTLIELYKNN